MNRYRDLRARLATARTALISGHVNPDGDSVGSSLALYHVLTARGVMTTLYSLDPYPYNFRFLPGADRVTARLPDEDPDLFFVVDAGAPERVGAPLFERLSRTTRCKVLFDHHVAHSDQAAFYDLSFLDDTAAATAILLHRFLREERIGMTPEIALSIYAAVMADTGGMRYSSTNREAFAVLSDLVDMVEPWEVAAHIWEEAPIGQMRLLAETLASIRLLADGRAAVFEVTREQMDRYGLGPDHIDTFINYARSIQGVEVAFRFRELAPGRYKVSLRSKGAIDASLVAHSFGGGGHRNAAGFEFKGSFAEGCALVEQVVARARPA